MKKRKIKTLNDLKAFVFSLCYGALCFLVRQYRIAKHTIQLRFTGDIRYQYEIDHYKEMKRFTSVFGFNAP